MVSNRCMYYSFLYSTPLLPCPIYFVKGDFSFDALFGNLVNELLPSFQEEDADSLEANGNINGNDALPNGRAGQGQGQGQLTPLFPEVDALLSMFKNSCSQLVEIRKQVYIDCITLFLFCFVAFMH